VSVKTRHRRISPARKVATDVLRRVEAEGAFASLALDHAFDRHPALSSVDRSLASQLVYGTLRWRRRLDYVLAAHSRRPLERIEPQLLRILRMVAYQLLFLDRVPEFAAVDEGTGLAAILRGKRAAGFVNAVARGLARAKDRLEWPDPDKDFVRYLEVVHSFPSWMIRMWLKQLGQQETIDLMESLNKPAPLWLRANTIKGPTSRLLELLAASGLKTEESSLVPDAVKVEGVGDLTTLAAHEAGWLHVQDAGAQAVCQLVSARPGQRILDACAAPGGKSATVVQQMKNQGELLAVDRNPARMGLVRSLAERLGLSIISRQVADVRELNSSAVGMFDRVLLDAPCSALGVLRRHPEGKWRITPQDLRRLSGIQAELLDAVSQLVKPGGVLIYSVCTMNDAEGPELIRSWLDDNREYSLDDPRKNKKAPWHKLVDNEGFLRTWPHVHQMDGFFAARMRRKD